MPLPADLAPALRQLSAPLSAVAEAWPAHRARGTAGRRLSVCPGTPAAESTGWARSMRQWLDDCREGAVTHLALPMATRLARMARSSPVRDLPLALRGAAALDRAEAEHSITLAAGPGAGGADAVDAADAATTQPWTPKPDSAAARSRRELLRISADFGAVLDDLAGDDKAEHLRVRLHLCTTVQELWHLRPDLFNLVARLRSQGEAQRRLDQVDRHFPSRAL